MAPEKKRKEKKKEKKEKKAVAGLQVEITGYQG